MTVYVGCATWAIAAEHEKRLPPGRFRLERYAKRLPATEVNSSCHESWFADDVDAFLAEREVARVAADPAKVPRAADPGGWKGLRYHRLHGSPRTYYSSYSREYLEALAARLRAETVETWCIFDNTASGAALGNALDLRDLLA